MKKTLCAAAVLLFLAMVPVALHADEAQSAAKKEVPAEFQLKYWKLVAEHLSAEVTLTKQTEAAKNTYASEIERVSKEVKALAAEAGAKAGCVVVSVKDGLACQEKK